MAGVASHGGWRRHFRIARNAQNEPFGSVPAALNWNYIPILGDGFKLKATSERFVPAYNYGGYRRAVAILHQHTVEGDITVHPFPQVALFLLDAAFLRGPAAGINYQDTYAHVIDFLTPNDPRRYLGVNVESFTIANTGSGDGDTQFTLSCVAQSEREQGGLDEATFNYSGLSPFVPFMQSFARLWIDGVNVVDVEDWSLTLENNTERGPLGWEEIDNLGLIQYAIAGRRTISLDLTELNNDQRMNDAIREGTNISFHARYYHPAGHVMEIQLPKLYVPESEEDGTPSQQARETPRLEALATDAGNDIIYAVNLAAGSSTTLPTFTTTAAPTTTGAP